MPSELHFNGHAQPHARAMPWLGVYQAYTPGVKLGDNPTIRLDLDNEPQPDAVLLMVSSSRNPCWQNVQRTDSTTGRMKFFPAHRLHQPLDKSRG